MMTPSLHATSGARRSPAIEWVLPIGLLLLAAAKVYWLCWKAWDLPIYDDSGYLWNGWVYLHESGLPSANWSPLYAVWEGVIFYFFEPFGILAVFVAVRLAAVVLSAVVLFIWLRRNLSQTTAWLLAALFLILRGIVDMEMSTTVHQFTLVPVLLITALAGTRGTYVKGAVLGSLLLLTMLRTEYSLAFALTLAGYVAMDVRTLRADRRLRPLLWGYAPLALAAALVALMLHVAKAPENRSWIAFEQHFYWTYQERQPEKFEGKPVGAADWDTLAAEYFGDADSVLEAVIANPGAVAGHMLYNASQLPHALSVLLVPAGAPRWLELVIEALTLLTVVLALANLWRRRRDLPGWLHDHWPVVLTYGSILIVNLGSAILLMVRFNLLIPAIPLLMLLAGLLIDLAARELRLWLAEIPVEGNRLLLIGCALFLALSPAPFRFGTPECSLNSITQTLNDLVADEHARGPYQFLSITGESQHLCRFINMLRQNEHCLWIGAGNIPQGTLEQAAMNGASVRLIYLDDASIPGFAGNENAPYRFLSALIANPERLGWDVAVAGDEFRIYHLMKAPGDLFDCGNAYARPALLTWAMDDFQDGDRGSARELMSSYISNFPDDSIGYEMRARVRPETDGWQAVEQDVLMALELGGHEELFLRLGDVYFFRAGDLQRALNAYTNYLTFGQVDQSLGIPDRLDLIDTLLLPDGSFSTLVGYQEWYDRQPDTTALPAPAAITQLPLTWEPVEPEDMLEQPINIQWGIYTRSLLLMPPWIGMAETIATQAQATISQVWSGSQLVFLAHMPRWTYDTTTDGVELELEFPDLESDHAQSVLIDTSVADWWIITVDVPELTADTTLHIAVNPHDSTIGDALWLTFVGLAPAS